MSNDGQKRDCLNRASCNTDLLGVCGGLDGLG